MASTFAPINAFDYAKAYIKSMPLERVQTRVLDDVNKIMWMAAPWRWTIGAFPNVTLAATTQDYTPVIPADFLYLLDSYVTDQAGGIVRRFDVVPQIPAGGIIGQPNRVAVTGTPGQAGQYRVSPKPGTIPAGGWTAISLYKKTAPTVSESNASDSGLLVFDDEWFWVYVSGVLWQAYLFGDDQRAGQAQVQNGSISYSGQRGVFEANLQWMREREKLHIIEDSRGDTKAGK